jgi:uncharacterized protein (DUF1810 family)
MKRTILDYFSPQRKGKGRSSAPTPTPPYPLLDSGRKENDFTTFYSSSNLDYPDALHELKILGRKSSHWIWYILPQLASLGSSSQAIWYGIKSLPEARNYLHDPLLGSRLIEISQVIYTQLITSKIPIRTLMGGGIDASKLLSSVTLFYFASYSTPHQTLFDELRQCCEIRLKKQDSKTILFCEESLFHLRLPVPTSHEEIATEPDSAPDSTTSTTILPTIHQHSSTTLIPPEPVAASPEVKVVVEPETGMSYPLLLSTRYEYDFKLFYRFSSSHDDHRYFQLLNQINTSLPCVEYHPWLWFLLPQLVPLPDDSPSPNSLYFSLCSFPECESFYRDEILGFQLIELLGVICHRLVKGQERVEQVMLSHENAMKLLSTVTLFSLVSEEVEDESLPYLHRVRVTGVGSVGNNDDSKKISIDSPRGLLALLKKIIEEELQKKDNRVIAFCEESLRVIKDQGQGEEVKGSDEGSVVIVEEDERKEESIEIDDKGEETEEEAQETHSIDSDSHEYNEYTYQLEGMELQTPLSPPIEDDTDMSS